METLRYKAESKAFTLVELLVTMAIIGILASLLLPTVSQGIVRAKRARCAVQLKDLGLAFHQFAHEHDSQFPVQVLGAQGMAAGANNADALLNDNFAASVAPFVLLANELHTPRTLICPADRRTSAPSFQTLGPLNLSYLAGLSADYRDPNSILLVDRNVTNLRRSVPVPLMTGGVGAGMGGWTMELHQTWGNVLFADAHVETRETIVLRRAVRAGLMWAGQVATPFYPAAAWNRPLPAAPTTWLGMPTYLLQAGEPRRRTQPASAVQQYVAAPPVVMPSAWQPAEEPSVSASRPSPANPPKPPVAAIASRVAELKASSPFNYWWLLVILLIALALRHILLKTVSKSGRRGVGDAAIRRNWSKRYARD